MQRTYYIINKETGARLCQDNKWRTFAHNGTFSSCVKVWKRKGWAWRKAFRIGRKSVFVLGLDENLVMDAAGHIYDETRGENKHVGHCLEMSPKILFKNNQEIT